MAVLFKIEYVSRDGSPVMAELLEKEKNFCSTKNMRLGGISLREGFSVPRAHDREGNPRYDLFVFETRKDARKHQLKPGDVVLLEPGDGLEFLKPWEACDPEQSTLQEELYLELPETHPLFGKTAGAVARRVDCDDVLFRLEEDQYAVVHLTWSGKKEKFPDYPATRIFGHWTEVYDEVILADHEDFK